MTKKRFTQTGTTFDGFCDILDNGVTICSVRLEYADTLLFKLNSLNDSNEQLIKELVDAETKLYKANEDLLMMGDYDALIQENQDNEFEIINLKKKNEQLASMNQLLLKDYKEIIKEADDLITSHLSKHYQRQWKNFCERRDVIL